MQEAVYRVIGVLCAGVAGTPIGTNLGLVQLLWMLVSGRLLESRGAVIPGLSATGLSESAVRRAWAALGQGDWSSAGLLAAWRRHVEQRGVWQAHEHAGYQPAAVDVTGFWRPRRTAALPRAIMRRLGSRSSRSMNASIVICGLRRPRMRSASIAARLVFRT